MVPYHVWLRQRSWDFHWRVHRMKQVGMTFAEIGRRHGGMSSSWAWQVNRRWRKWMAEGRRSPMEVYVESMADPNHLAEDLVWIGWFRQIRRNALVAQEYARQIEERLS